MSPRSSTLTKDQAIEILAGCLAEQVTELVLVGADGELVGVLYEAIYDSWTAEEAVAEANDILECRSSIDEAYDDDTPTAFFPSRGDD